jgi:hypothetical protein
MRWDMPNDESLVRGTKSVGIDTGSAAFLSPSTPPMNGGQNLAYWQVGVWRDQNTEVTPTLEAAVVNDATNLTQTNTIRTTPGYTPADSWALTWQGPLPGLSARRAVFVMTDPSGAGTIALQVPMGALSSVTAWSDVAPVFDPSLAIHPNDIVELALDPVQPDGRAPDGCTTSAPTTADPTSRSILTLESQVTAVPLPPDAANAPGGSLPLSPISSGCAAQLTVGKRYVGVANVRASGLVLTGISFGYAGRPDLEPAPPPSKALSDRFQVRYPQTPGGEDALAAQCAFCTPDQPDCAVPLGAATVPACDVNCRATCEQLHIARKARPLYYPGADEVCPNPKSPPTGTTVCTVFDPAGGDTGFNPLSTGPVLGLRAGKLAVPGYVNGVANQQPADADLPPRDAQVIFTTRSGLTPMGRVGTSGGLPSGVVGFDRSVDSSGYGLGIVFYGSYLGDSVFRMSPGTAVSSYTTIH